MNKKKVSISIMLIVASLLMFSPVATYANEVNDNNEVIVTESEESIQEETQAENSAEKEEKGKDTTENTSVDNQKVDDNTNQNNDQTNNKNSNESTNTQSTIEEHKVAVITTKVDEYGNPLKGAVLQILDSNGNVVDEWESNGEEHTSLLPEGNYILHEVSAPEGYKLAADKTFTIKVEMKDINAGADFSETPCSHYGRTLYYVEIKGEKYEVYCINQDWETPNNTIYDGAVLNPADIKNYTTQTVYIDSHKNTEAKDISDQSLSKEELYDKVLDIIYHRQKASSIFSDLSEAEIRYVTEAALKNYTNAGLTRVQRKSIANAPENYESTDYYITEDGKYMWYLYPWYRSFVYDPTAPLEQDIFREVIGEGDAFGTLARHWSDPAIVNGIITGHNAKNSEEVRQIIARYYELYLYLINDSDHHPSDMHLYIYSTKEMTSKGENYQNLLGVIWYNPYDENHVVNLTMVNKKAPESPKKETPKKVKKSSIVVNPQTGDNIISYVITLTLSIASLVGVSSYRKKEF